jgi:hypothetical protein
LHEDEVAYIEKLAKQYAKEKGISLKEAKAYLMIAAYTIVDIEFNENEKNMSKSRRQAIEEARKYIIKNKNNENLFKYTESEKNTDALSKQNNLIDDRKWTVKFNDLLKPIFEHGPKDFTITDSNGKKITFTGYVVDVDWLYLNQGQNNQYDKYPNCYGQCLGEAQYYTQDDRTGKELLTEMHIANPYDVAKLLSLGFHTGNLAIMMSSLGKPGGGRNRGNENSPFFDHTTMMQFNNGNVYRFENFVASGTYPGLHTPLNPPPNIILEKGGKMPTNLKPDYLKLSTDKIIIK